MNDVANNKNYQENNGRVIKENNNNNNDECIESSDKSNESNNEINIKPNNDQTQNHFEEVNERRLLSQKKLSKSRKSKSDYELSVIPSGKSVLIRASSYRSNLD